MTSFSDSPGSIYPALRRLEQRGLVRSRVQERSGLRRRRLFHLTPAGISELKRWQKQPIVRDDIIRGTGELMLRFSFMDESLGPVESLRFLTAFKAELTAYIPTLRGFLEGHGKDMVPSGRLALESGINSYEGLLQLGTQCDQKLRKRLRKELTMIVRVILYCLLGGAAFMLPALGAGHAPWWWLSGVLVTAAFVPVVLFGPKTALGQFCVIFPVLFLVSVLTTWSEAVIFIKSPLIQEHAVANLIYDTIGHLIAAVVLAVLWKILKLTQPSAATILRPPLMKAVGLIALCAFVYVACYLVFGSITYQFFTKKYYPGGAAIAESMGIWFWLIEIGRGLLITLGHRSRHLHAAPAQVGYRNLRGAAALDRWRPCSVDRAKCVVGRRAAIHPHHRNPHRKLSAGRRRRTAVEAKSAG